MKFPVNLINNLLKLEVTDYLISPVLVIDRVLHESVKCCMFATTFMKTDGVPAVFEYRIQRKLRYPAPWSIVSSGWLSFSIQIHYCISYCFGNFLINPYNNYLSTTSSVNAL